MWLIPQAFFMEKKKRRNLFKFSSRKHLALTFKVIHKVYDMHNYLYIIRFRDSSDNEFGMMASDFETQVKKGIILFA